MDEAEQLCDRVAIVDHGRLVACGSPAELVRAADDDRTHFSAVPELEVTALAAAIGIEAAAVREERPGEYVVERALTPVMVAQLTAWMAERDVAIRELRAGAPSLEEVFLRLTGEGRT
jgi:ABC-2 type transport system ATP-binding protein